MTIATRTLTIVTEATERIVPVTLSRPTQSANGAWSCAYSIGWPDEPFQGAGWGYDAFQALQLSMELIGAHLYASPYHKAGQLVFTKAGAGYGFVVPRSIRDHLVGQDRADQI